MTSRLIAVAGQGPEVNSCVRRNVNMDGNTISMCRKALERILAISPDRIRTVQQKLTTGFRLPVNQRYAADVLDCLYNLASAKRYNRPTSSQRSGLHHNRPNRVPDANKYIARRFILSLATETSHHCVRTTPTSSIWAVASRHRSFTSCSWKY